jgi:hypothetical protein
MPATSSGPSVPYARSKYLIYCKFATKQREDSSSIGGSLLMGAAMTVEEANEKIAMYSTRREEFDAKFPSSAYSSTSEYVYIVNNPEWWAHAKLPA